MLHTRFSKKKNLEVTVSRLRTQLYSIKKRHYIIDLDLAMAIHRLLKFRISEWPWPFTKSQKPGSANGHGHSSCLKTRTLMFNSKVEFQPLPEMHSNSTWAQIAATTLTQTLLQVVFRHPRFTLAQISS